MFLVQLCHSHSSRVVLRSPSTLLATCPTGPLSTWPIQPQVLCLISSAIGCYHELSLLSSLYQSSFTFYISNFRFISFLVMLIFVIHDSLPSPDPTLIFRQILQWYHSHPSILPQRTFLSKWHRICHSASMQTRDLQQCHRPNFRVCMQAM